MMTMNNVNEIMSFINEACERNFDITCSGGYNPSITIRDKDNNEVSIRWGGSKSERYIGITTSNLGYYEFEKPSERDLKILDLIYLDIKEYRKNKAFDFINKFFPKIEETINDLDDDEN